MTLAIPIYFDSFSEAAIQVIWQELAAQKVAPYMAESGIRPHITLAIYRDIDRDACQALLSSLVQDLEPLQLTFSYLGIFTTPSPVVFLAPTVNQQLLDLHKKVNLLLDQVGEEPVPFYLPEKWVPHCTLAVEFEPDQINRVVEIARRMLLPITGWATELCLIEYPPAQHVFMLPLKPVEEG
jgi:2'-5' RNA ligase